MGFSWLLLLGFLAQALFGARSAVQWYLSEKQGKVVSPTLFWIFSLCGSGLFLVYGLLRHDGVILVGQSISFYIYVRNLQLKNAWRVLPPPVRWLVLGVPPLIVFLQVCSSDDFQLFDSFHALILLGVAGQLLLNCRYLYQWYYSERAHESLLPLGFWIISAVASLLVVAYSLYAGDAVLLVAQSLGLVVYARNIIIYFRRGLGHDSLK
ncbi:MAG: lipid-A-disaccharide synthase N-terminal domain-containing protein [Flammeovirgaceae bacterium]